MCTLYLTWTFHPFCVLYCRSFVDGKLIIHKRVRLISTIIVNYNSSDLLIDCLDSLKRQLVMDNGEIVPLEVIVVDNSSSQSEREKLSQIDHDIVRVIKKDTNIGFARANNLGYRLARGNYILFINPDTYLFEGALDSLYNFLNASAAGAVGPKFWWDKEKTFLLPMNQPPTIFGSLLELSGTKFLNLGRFLSHRWQKKSLDYWCTDKPLKVNMISGGSMLVRREVINEVGLFDETYSLYFEDADWCRRVLKKGYTIYYYPAAEIVHYYNQSAKKVSDESRQNFARSADIYFNKNFGFISNRIKSSVSSYMLSKGEMLMDDFEEIDVYGNRFDTSLINGFNTGKKYLLEISINRLFIPSAGAFLNEPVFKINSAILERLEPGHYFTRLTSLADMKVIKKWHWIKEPERMTTQKY